MPRRCPIRFAPLLLAFTVLSGAVQSADIASRWDFGELPALPNPVGVAGAFAGVVDGQLVVAGGANFPDQPPWEGGRKVWHDRVYALSSPDAQWSEAGTLPGPLAYGVSVPTENGLLLIGGSDDRQHHAEVWELSGPPEQPVFTPLPPLPIPLANACGARLGDMVYVAGGTTKPDAVETLRRFWALEIGTREATWRELEAWPGPGRILAVAAAQSGAFYLFSGTDLEAGTDGAAKRRYLKDAYCYRPGEGWRRIADLPWPTVAAPSPAPAVGQSHCLILGGDDGSQIGRADPQQHTGFRRSLLAYHTITDTWAELGALPSGPVTAPAVHWDDRWLVASGEVRPGVRSPAMPVIRLDERRAGFGGWNYAALALYLGAMVALGSSFMRRNRDTNDFFRGGQRIPWWAAGLSIFATMLSSITFMAIPAQAYGVGWNLYLGNSYLLLTPLVVLVYLPFYRRLDVTSAYEYLERRFNTATRLLASALFMLFQCGRIAIVLYLPALALSTVSDLDVTTCVLGMGILCVLYTVLGGVEAVIWTDAAQAVVLMGGAVWALATLVFRIDGGWSAALTTAADQGRFFSSVPWSLDLVAGTGWVILVGSLFANLFSYTASQDVVQRYLTTASERGAARAIWVNALVSPLAQALFFAIGTALFVYYRQHPDRLDPLAPTDGIFPLFIVNELPAGIAGLIVAAVFAAAQSSLSSSLNSVAAAWVTDFHGRLRPTTTEAGRLRLARWITAIVGVAGTLVALVLARSDIRSLWETFLGVIGLFGGTISGLFVLGIFTRRADGRGALIGAIVSAGLVFAIKFGTSAHFFTYPVAGVLSCVAVGWLASERRSRSGSNLNGLTVHSLRPSGETPATS